jgi:hypothetical protein
MSDRDAVDFVLGLDLGQQADYTALAVLERRKLADPRRPDVQLPCQYALRHLKRWQLKTSYTAIVAEVVALVKTPPLSWPMLAIDQTGVGAAVVDMFRQAAPEAQLRPVLITTGHEVRIGNDGAYHLPKKELVSVLQVLLQSRRLKVANVPERELLVKELQNFRVKVTVAANETFEAWRERDHDDLVLAVAMAAWLAEATGYAGVMKAVEVERDAGRAWALRQIFGSR